jgi:hypothetical protein
MKKGALVSLSTSLQVGASSYGESANPKPQWDDLFDSMPLCRNHPAISAFSR